MRGTQLAWRLVFPHLDATAIASLSASCKEMWEMIVQFMANDAVSLEVLPVVQTLMQESSGLSCRSMRAVSLSGNDPSHFELLVAYWKFENLRVLDITNARIGASGCRNLRLLLLSLPLLEELHADRCNITKDGIYDLSDGLQSCPYLRVLSLRSNGLHSEGIMTLCESITCFPLLQTLLLDNNSICEDGLDTLLHSLPSCPQLLYLSISQNYIGASSLVEIASQLRDQQLSPLLQRLSMAEMRVHADNSPEESELVPALRVLMEALPQGIPALQRFSFSTLGSDGSIDMYDWELQWHVILPSLACCPHLVELDLSCRFQSDEAWEPYAALTLPSTLRIVIIECCYMGITALGVLLRWLQPLPALEELTLTDIESDTAWSEERERERESSLQLVTWPMLPHLKSLELGYFASTENLQMILSSPHWSQSIGLERVRVRHAEELKQHSSALQQALDTILSHKEHLYELTLAYCGLNQQHIASLGQYSLGRLRTLTLSGNSSLGTDPALVPALTHLLQSNRSLMHIALDATDLSDATANGLLPAFAAMPLLQDLRLSSNYLTDNVLQLFIYTLPMSVNLDIGTQKSQLHLAM